jgi:hypothetical protein
MGRYLEFLAEAISPEDRKKITDYAKGLKSWLKKNYPGPDWRVSTSGSVRANPYIRVDCGWPEKKVPNELRLKLVDAIYPQGRSTIRNIDDVEYGNVSERGLAAQYSQWVIVTGEQLNEALSVGDKVKLSKDALSKHAKTVPAHAGYTTEQFSWRKTLDELKGKVGKIERIFPNSKHVNVDFDGHLIGIDSTSLELINENEQFNESGMIRIAVPYTDRRMAQKTLDDMGYDYEIGNSITHSTAVVFDITIDEQEDVDVIKHELRLKRVRLLTEASKYETVLLKGEQKKLFDTWFNKYKKVLQKQYEIDKKGGLQGFDLTLDQWAEDRFMELEPAEDQSKIIQGYCPTITDSKERLFVAFSGGLTRDYKKSYCVPEKEAIDIAKRYIKREKYDGAPGAVPVNGKNELLNESVDEDLVTAYETGKKAGEAHANKDQGTVSHHSDWFKKFKRLSKADKQALEAEYTKGYRETSGFNNKPSYFR